MCVALRTRPVVHSRVGLYTSTRYAQQLVHHLLLVAISFLARDAIYTSRAYATMSASVCLSVRLSVTEVHWRII